MRVYIKDFWPSTVYMDQKSDYLIIAQLDNGMIVELFDFRCFAREFEINTTIDCLILAFYVHIMNFNEYEKKGYDIALIANNISCEIKYSKVEQQVIGVLKKAGLLKKTPDSRLQTPD